MEGKIENHHSLAMPATPKLNLSFSYKPPPLPEPPGMVTPPLQPVVSVPFLWEEAPGRPKPTGQSPCKPRSARCLELPPGVVGSAHGGGSGSPVSVLDGLGRLGETGDGPVGERRGSDGEVIRPIGIMCEGKMDFSGGGMKDKVRSSGSRRRCLTTVAHVYCHLFDRVCGSLKDFLRRCKQA
ncbi:hypothetical protein Droror1_Dr00009428 [Drosera rotundifolia]